MKNIKVLSLNLVISEVELIDSDEKIVGQINHLTGVITVKKGITEEKKKVVLLHEILHSIFEQLGFDAEHDNEHLINSLSTSLIQVFEENKNLF